MTIGYCSCDHISWPAYMYVSDGDQTHYVNQRLGYLSRFDHSPSATIHQRPRMLLALFHPELFGLCGNKKIVIVNDLKLKFTLAYCLKKRLRNSIRSYHFCIGLSSSEQRAPAASSSNLCSKSTAPSTALRRVSVISSISICRRKWSRRQTNLSICPTAAVNSRDDYVA